MREGAIRKSASLVLMGAGLLWLAVTGVCGSVLLREPAESRLSSEDTFYGWLIIGASLLAGAIVFALGWWLRRF
jgi:hypothetical protein